MDTNSRTTGPPDVRLDRKTLSTVRLKKDTGSTPVAASDNLSQTSEAALVIDTLSASCIRADCVSAALLGRYRGWTIVIRLGQRNTLRPTGKAGTRLWLKDSTASPSIINVIRLPFVLQNIIGQPLSLKTMGAHSIFSEEYLRLSVG